MLCRTLFHAEAVLDGSLANASPDARVQSAIQHWAPRFVANGVPLTDFEEVTAGIERWDDWCAAWCARAAAPRAVSVGKRSPPASR